eukprot:gene49378-66163_t
MYDKLNTFGTDQAVTTTAASTDIIDFGAVRDVGNGEPLELVILCTETVTASGAATVSPAAMGEGGRTGRCGEAREASDGSPRAYWTTGVPGIWSVGGLKICAVSTASKRYCLPQKSQPTSMSPRSARMLSASS